MNQENRLAAAQALKQAKKALRQGNKSQVHLWASLAARLSPDNEDPWLILAAIGGPRASEIYAKQALLLNPDNKQASKALKWALHRQEANNSSLIPDQSFLENTQKVVLNRRSHSFRYMAIIPWVITVLILCAVLLMVSFVPAGWVLANNITANNVIIVAPRTTSTSTQTLVLTATITPSPTSSITITASATETPTSTVSPTPLPSETASATPPPPPTEIPLIHPYLPETINDNDRWIDVDLSKQLLYAYEGDQIVNTFTVSTGTWEHPTVTGQYRIYIKYLYDDMTGPGYYLPDVPYTMYFYKGYSLHGTYWHDNFGTPMSHGCVNLRTEDAAWVFDFTSEGTLVNIHY